MSILQSTCKRVSTLSYHARYVAIKVGYTSLRRHQSTRQDVDFKILKANVSRHAIDKSTLQQTNIELDDIELSLPANKFSFNTTWLRDSCHCEQCTHPSSRQRLFTPKDFRREMFSVSKVNLITTPNSRDNHHHHQQQQLEIDWVDGHKSLYPVNWLRDINSLYENGNPSNHLGRDPLIMQLPEDDFYAPTSAKKCISVPWNVAHIKSNLQPVNYRDLVDGCEEDQSANSTQNSDDHQSPTKRLSAMESLTHQLVTHGLAKVVDVPLERNQVLKVARSLAYERVTGYGVSFDVVVEPTEEINLAYSSLELGFHSDLTYREISPGVQLLHCIKNSSEGGLSFFSDAFNAAQLLRRSDPVLFEVLLNFPATFMARDPYRNVVFRHQKPVITVDYQGDLQEIYYSFFKLPPVGSKDDVKLFYLAYDKFTKLLQAQENKLIEKMSPGDLFIFHNRRVLHGRSSYDAKSSRFLQGCYMDWDEIKCLREKLQSNKISSDR